MNQIQLLNDIKNYLTRFQLLVKIANAENEYDINNHAENIIIPILNIVFDDQFKNENIDKKNKEAIDLKATNKRLAVQVTSTSSLEKVKNTLGKFVKHNLHRHIDHLYIYILTERQKSYSQDAINKITKSKFKFNAKLHIIDAKDVYGKIKALNDLEIFKRVYKLLLDQFSDSFITDSFSFNNYEEFKEDYTKKCLTNFSRLNFFGLSVSKRPREVELYDLFVKPVFRFGPTLNKILFEEKIFLKSLQKRGLKQVAKAQVSHLFKIGEMTDVQAVLEADIKSKGSFLGTLERNYDKFFSFGDNIALLGNPGAGKSSMIKYTICKILENDYSVFENKDVYDYIPFRLELHKYNQAKVNRRLGLVDFLVETLITEYQCDLSKEKTLKILNYFPTLMFFDGLDEIFDVQERVSVRNDIENFAKDYLDSKIVVTSRYESYEEVSLDEKLFSRVEVRNFDQSQLEDYVTKWYHLEENNEVVRKEEIVNCLAQLEQVDGELKFNPLLLSLIVILYRNDLELPTNKLSIYEGCTNTIVETRDSREKKLGIALKVNSKISVFSALAFWQFGSKASTINNTSVYNFIKGYLLEKNEFQEDHLAGMATTEFLEFAKTRSIYFENKFTHKTFLEYFTAYYIFSKYYFKHNNLKKFDEILNKNLGLSSWAVVLELLICKIDSNLIDNDVIDQIVESQLKINRNDAVLFFLQLVKYLANISERIVIELLEIGISLLFEKEFFLKEGKADQKDLLFVHIANILKQDRFHLALHRAFKNIILKNEITLQQLGVLAYELKLLTGCDELVKCLANDEIIDTDPYLFILANWHKLNDKKRFLEIYSKFLTLFSIKSSAYIYEAHFDQHLFLGGKFFNWNIFFLLNFIEKNNLAVLLEDLNKLGIKNDTLERSITKEIISFPKIHFLIKKTQNSGTSIEKMLNKQISKLISFESEKINIVLKS